MLLSACEQGDQETVEQLVLTEDLEQKNSQGLTPLAIAAKMGNTEILDVLLDAGANMNTTSNVKFTQ